MDTRFVYTYKKYIYSAHLLRRVPCIILWTTVKLHILILCYAFCYLFIYILYVHIFTHIHTFIYCAPEYRVGDVFKLYILLLLHSYIIKYASSHVIHQHSYAPSSCNCSDSEMNRFYECRSSGFFLGSKGLHETLLLIHPS